ncbi:hypothetical protein [Methylocystis sp. S23]
MLAEGEVAHLVVEHGDGDGRMLNESAQARFALGEPLGEPVSVLSSSEQVDRGADDDRQIVLAESLPAQSNDAVDLRPRRRSRRLVEGDDGARLRAVFPKRVEEVRAVRPRADENDAIRTKFLRDATIVSAVVRLGHHKAVPFKRLPDEPTAVRGAPDDKNSIGLFPRLPGYVDVNAHAADSVSNAVIERAPHFCPPRRKQKKDHVFITAFQ